LTLFFVPVIYRLFMVRSHRVRDRVAPAATENHPVP
jgi:hypothetical protein